MKCKRPHPGFELELPYPFPMMVTITPLIYIYTLDIGIMFRVFTYGSGDLGSVPGRVIPKTQKWYFDASLLNAQHYKVQIKGKVEQSRERCSALPTPWCSSYRKGSLRVTLDYSRQLYFYFLYIYIYTHTHTHN